MLQNKLFSIGNYLYNKQISIFAMLSNGNNIRIKKSFTIICNGKIIST